MEVDKGRKEARAERRNGSGERKEGSRGGK